jgi:hypothetical protein
VRSVVRSVHMLLSSFIVAIVVTRCSVVAHVICLENQEEKEDLNVPMDIKTDSLPSNNNNNNNKEDTLQEEMTPSYYWNRV